MTETDAPFGRRGAPAFVKNQDISARLHQCATGIQAAQDEIPAAIGAVLRTVETDLYQAADEMWLASEALQPAALRLLGIILEGCIDRVQLCLFGPAIQDRQARHELARTVTWIRELSDSLHGPGRSRAVTVSS